MNGNEYQKKAHSFATKGGDTMAYATLGLVEEVGELCEKTVFAEWRTAELMKLMGEVGRVAGMLAKEIRKEWEGKTDRQRTELQTWNVTEGFSKEIGDCAWMLANVAYHAGKGMDDVLRENIDKLTARKRNGTIIGKGDTDAERMENRRREERGEGK